MTVLQIERRWKRVLSVTLSSPAQAPQVPHNTAESVLSISGTISPAAPPEMLGTCSFCRQWDGQRESLASVPFRYSMQRSTPYFALSARKSQIFTSRVAKRCQRRMWGRAPNCRTETLYCLQLILVHSEHIASILLIIKC